MKKLIMIIMAFLLLAFITVPVYGASQIIGPDTIYKQKESLVTISDIVQLYSSYGNIIILKNDGYTGNGATIGTYDVTIAASDGLNETAQRTIQVKVVDTFGTYKIRLITDSKSIYTMKDQVLQHKEIIIALAMVNLIQYSSTTSMPYLIKDDYTENASTPGYYPFHFRIIDVSGFDKSYQSFIYVTADSLLPIDGEIDMGDGSGDVLSDAFNWAKNNWLLIGMLIVGFFFFKNKKQNVF